MRKARSTVSSLVLIVSLVLSAGCSIGLKEKPVAAQEWKVQAGVNKLTMEHGGVSRKFIVHVPKGYRTAELYPVVFAFHGAGRTNHDWL
ncbi:MAG: hypothetical protein U9N45_08585, partial [Gemmatimonadota bacterium]|nr:hypothetical protein [Gemmatimonadota bacterium]